LARLTVVGCPGGYLGRKQPLEATVKWLGWSWKGGVDSGIPQLWAENGMNFLPCFDVHLETRAMVVAWSFPVAARAASTGQREKISKCRGGRRAGPNLQESFTNQFVAKSAVDG
jgi:hypothetical protein